MATTASTWGWAMRSEGRRWRRLSWLALALCSLVLSPGAGEKSGKVFLTLDEALELAFPKCEVERTTLYLTKPELKRAAKLAKVDVERALVRAYVARKDGELVGTAYFDRHEVRTLKEVVMFVVDPEARLQRIEVLAFGEPLDYLPRASWYAQFKGKQLDDKLSLKGAIKGVTGATLTAHATTNAARRVLAVHQVVGERE